MSLQSQRIKALIAKYCPHTTNPLQQKPFTDNDLEGIVNAIIHGQLTGYFRDDKEWAETMVNRISEMRKPK